MKIKISLGNISEAIKQVEAYKQSLADKQREFLQRLAEIGVSEASARFSTAQYDGTNDVKVDAPEWIDENKIAVRAVGNAVTFIEFGTGVFYNTFADTHPPQTNTGFTLVATVRSEGETIFGIIKANREQTAKYHQTRN